MQYDEQTPITDLIRRIEEFNFSSIGYWLPYKNGMYYVSVERKDKKPSDTSNPTSRTDAD